MGIASAGEMNRIFNYWSTFHLGVIGPLPQVQVLAPESKSVLEVIGFIVVSVSRATKIIVLINS